MLDTMSDPKLTDCDEDTPAMIQAGVHAFWSFDARFEGAEDVVKRIWCDMNAVRNDGAKAGEDRNAPTLSITR